MLRIGIVGKGIDADAAAGHEVTGDLEVFGIHEADQVLHDDIDAILVEIAVVAEGKEVELEALALDHPFPRDIGDIDMSEIGLPGLGAERRELGTIESDEVLILRVLIGKSLQHLGVILIAIVRALVAQEGDALQFLICSHNYLIILRLCPFSVSTI